MKSERLRTEFQNWMSHQKKSNDEPYKKNTITAYMNAIKNSSAKLNLSGLPTLDLFTITSLEDFTKIHNQIIAAPNFREVDLSAGNKAYSNGMILYAKFLKEREEPSTWIFQGNPKHYDVVQAVDDLDQLTWAVNQYPKQIKEGDEAYIWLSGSGGGIIAAGTVLNDPEIREPLENDPYRKNNQLNNEPYLSVDISIEKKLTEDVVERNLLLEDERTKNLEILTYPGATNFKVKKEENEIIKEIINGTYENIPVAVLSEDEKKEEKRFWIYAPGLDSEHWEEFYKNGIMGTRREEIGDLKLYPTKSAIKDKMKEIYGEEFTYRNAGHAAWQFANEMKVGDVIFVKKGLSKIIGRGIVSSDYFYDISRKEYNHVRKVNWTHKGEWDHEGQAVAKMLTDVTPYTEYYKKLESNFYNVPDDSDPSYEEEVKCSNYTEIDFLSEVYISKEKYHTLKNLLMRKKNLILLGAPGVGKTYAAERLAYSMMGKKDKSRVQVVQFHQSYSYEDFIMGYRPSEKGFSIVEGPFYEFCKKAEPDDRPYFFIIDEINRGNLSKIFGELLMLIEDDKRGKELRLLYSDEQFSVPENVYIIGMMNTADRSLAMIDYALRRRFAFFEFEPAFESVGFKDYQSEIDSEKFDRLIQSVIAMNNEIADDAALGTGFRIGHSYFSSRSEINDQWLEEVVEYELIPLITEYWFDEPSQITQWSGKLRGAIR